MAEEVGPADVEQARDGARCRQPILDGGTASTLKKMQAVYACGLPAGSMFMGCPLCKTHLYAALTRAVPGSMVRRD